jgi:hypothetical protein
MEQGIQKTVLKIQTNKQIGERKSGIDASLAKNM